jgi:hypothetical protein
LEAYIDDKTLASTGIATLATIRRWRLEGKGPRYIKVGRLVKYRISDVRAFLDSRPCGGGRSEDRPSAA